MGSFSLSAADMKLFCEVCFIELSGSVFVPMSNEKFECSPKHCKAITFPVIQFPLKEKQSCVTNDAKLFSLHHEVDVGQSASPDLPHIFQIALVS